MAPTQRHDIPPDPPLLIPDLVSRVWRRKWTALVTAMVVSALVAGAVWAAIPARRFTAEATLLLTPSSRVDLMEKSSQAGANATDPFTVRSEVDVVKSDELCRKVIRQLGLIDNAELNEPTPLVLGLRWVKSALHLSARAEDELLDRAEQEMDAAIGDYQSRLTVANDGRSNTLQVQFAAPSPALAAKIANAHAQAYLAEQGARRVERTKQIVASLRSELVARAQELVSAEAKLQNFRRSVVSGESGADNEGELRALEVAATANKNAYEAVLSYFNIALAQQNIGTGEAFVISPAYPSIRAKSRKRMLLLGAGVLMAIGLGVGTALLLDVRSAGARSARGLPSSDPLAQEAGLPS